MAAPPRLYLASAQSATVALRQGEVFSGLVQLHLQVQSLREQAELVFDRKIHPFAVVLSQDCDLEQDFKARHGQVTQNAEDKIIPAVLFCEVTTAEGLRAGATVNSTMWSRIKVNKDERYHFLQKVEPADDALHQGLPELAIDFKRYFTIPAAELYRRIELEEAQRRCLLASPYLEHLSSRFAYFLSRIALPQDHLSE